MKHIYPSARRSFARPRTHAASPGFTVAIFFGLVISLLCALGDSSHIASAEVLPSSPEWTDHSPPVIPTPLPTLPPTPTPFPPPQCPLVGFRTDQCALVNQQACLCCQKPRIDYPGCTCPPNTVTLANPNCGVPPQICNAQQNYVGGLVNNCGVQVASAYGTLCGCSCPTDYAYSGQYNGKNTCGYTRCAERSAEWGWVAYGLTLDNAVRWGDYSGCGCPPGYGYSGTYQGKNTCGYLNCAQQAYGWGWVANGLALDNNARWGANGEVSGCGCPAGYVYTGTYQGRHTCGVPNCAQQAYGWGWVANGLALDNNVRWGASGEVSGCGCPAGYVYTGQYQGRHTCGVPNCAQLAYGWGWVANGLAVDNNVRWGSSGEISGCGCPGGYVYSGLYQGRNTCGYASCPSLAGWYPGSLTIDNNTRWGNSGEVSGCNCPAGQRYAGNFWGYNFCGDVCPSNQVQDCNNRRNGVTCTCTCPAGTTWNGSSCARQCQYKITVGAIQYWSQGTADINIAVAQSGSVPSCLNNIFAQCGSNGRTSGDLVPGQCHDDCVAARLLAMPNPNGYCAFWGGFRGSSAMSGASFIDENCNILGVTGAYLGGYGGATPVAITRADGTQYLTSWPALNYWNSPSSLPICGETLLAYGAFTNVSPVSLIWRDNYDLYAKTETTKFPLRSTSQDSWFIWRASKDAPLLVYDPEHKGEIVSGAQLFGTESFGKAWKNGYEALASLDQNTDGELSGDELSAMALWFDENRDGVSQKGEVKLLNQVGVTKVFVKPNDKQDVPLDLWADIGFERAVGGKVVTGRSVDWFSRAFSTRPDFSGKRTMDPRVNVAGGWNWVADSNVAASAETPGQGVLAFSDNGINVITGHSHIEYHVDDPQKKAQGVIMTFPFEGTKTIRKGKTEISFEIRQKDSVTVRSHATLSSDGTQMTGSSAVYHGEEKMSEYTWTAKRMDVNAQAKKKS